jgi:hypothetical protein
MKPIESETTALRIRACLLVLLLSGICLFLASFKTSRLSDEIWKELGLSRQDANHGISTSFMQGHFYYYSAKNAKNIAVGNRAAVVKELGAYAKEYVNSDAFKKEYMQERESRKPAAPKPAKTMDEVRKEQVETMQTAIKNIEPLLKMDNPEIRKGAKEGLEQFQKQLKDLENPNSELVKMLADGERLTFENNTANYKENMAKWERDYPANQLLLVKRRLQQFLDVTANVDYNAELKEQYGKKRFVNPSYESKGREWKQAFRAGKDATEAARAFAQEWIKEIK